MCRQTSIRPQCAAVYVRVLQCAAAHIHAPAVCCSVLQCAAVCCSVLQCVPVCCSVLQFVTVWCRVVQCSAVRCSAVQRARSNATTLYIIKSPSYATMHINLFLYLLYYYKSYMVTSLYIQCACAPWPTSSLLVFIYYIIIEFS